MEGVFLGIDLLNFILHAYSFSLTFVRQLPRGGSLSVNPTFRLQKHYKSVVGVKSPKPRQIVNPSATLFSKNHWETKNQGIYEDDY